MSPVLSPSPPLIIVIIYYFYNCSPLEFITMRRHSSSIVLPLLSVIDKRICVMPWCCSWIIVLRIIRGRVRFVCLWVLAILHRAEQEHWHDQTEELKEITKHPITKPNLRNNRTGPGTRKESSHTKYLGYSWMCDITNIALNSPGRTRSLARFHLLYADVVLTRPGHFQHIPCPTTVSDLGF